MGLSPDQVCAKYAARKVRVTIRELGEGAILVEGSQEGLQFLGELFLAQAEFSDCGFQIEPNGRGKALLTRSSTTGLYVHRLHKAGKNGRRNGKASKKHEKARA